MAVTLYLWLLAVVLIGMGGGLVARGWWLDKAAGNHKRARCRKCWYELAGTPAGADDATTCPECGTVARGERELHRVKRNKWMTAAGLVLVAGGVYLSGRPLLSNGQWLYMLPRGVSARVWQWAGAENYGRDLKRRMAQGIATDAEIESLRGQNRALVLKAAKATFGAINYSDLDAAFKALALEEADPQVEEAAGVIQVDRMAMNARSAISYLEARKVPMARRIAMAEAALAKTTAGGTPTEYFQMLQQSSKDPDAMASLIRAASSKAPYASWARSCLTQPGNEAAQAVAAAYLASKNPQERSNLFKLFEAVYPFERDPALIPFLLELAAEPRQGAQAAQMLNQVDVSQVSNDQLKEWLLSGESAKVNFVLGIVMIHGVALPEGCGQSVLKMRDGGRMVDLSVLSRFTGADRLLWLPRLEKGSLESRREACQVVRQMRAAPAEAVDILRTIERDPDESEEMRVEARDALRQLGAWNGGVKTK